MLQVLRDDPPSEPADIRADLSSVIEDLDRIQRLLSAVTELERLPNDAGDLDPAETDLPSFTESVLRGLEHPTHDVRLEAEQAAAPIDQALVGGALANLIDNALTHTTTWVKAWTTPGWVRCVVEDDEPRIPPEMRDAIFGPFERGPSPDPTPAMGLGLAIVRGVAELHGGSVTIGERDGGGASLRLAVTTVGRLNGRSCRAGSDDVWPVSGLVPRRGLIVIRR